MSKAHLGVLFLDEFPLFPRDVVEALREPLEAGEISISRGEEDATYPARTMFVFACNPCPCGEYHPYSRDHHCTCREVKRREYRAKISGPIADRIDITRFVEPLSAAQRGAQDLPFDRPESSAVDPGPRHGRSTAAAGALRRDALAAQRPRPGPGAAGAVAADRRGGVAPRRRGVRRAAHPARRGPGAPGGVVGGRPAGVDRPGIEEVDVALRLRSATPLRLASVTTMRGGEPGGVGVSGPDEAERLARVLLSRIGEPGDPRLTDLVHELGAHPGARRACAHRRPTGSSVRTSPSGSSRPTRRGSSSGRPRWGSGSSYPVTRSGPPCLDDLAHAPHLHERGGVPVGLWCRGSLRLDEATEHAVAVVGSRSATTYGADVATGIATTSWPVSPGASCRGRRSASTRPPTGVRSPARGTTVAVLACGADRAYPAAHRNLIDYIADVGLVVSEAAPGCAPTRIRFLARNRIIAAAARGVVVVEAAVRSGALNTASWAAGLGRTVMAVPGPVTSAPSAGAHQLIRARDALLVTSGEEVLEAVGPMGAFALADPREPESAARPAVEPGAAGARRGPAGARRRLRLDRSHRRSRAHPHQGGPARPAPRWAGRALAGALAARHGASGDPLRVEETG